jgi:D-apiose dehydrogenase
MTRLRVATIGAGYFSQFHHDAWSRHGRGGPRLPSAIRMRTRRAPSRSATERLASRPTPMPRCWMRCKPDLVDIALRPPAHLALVRLAAERGHPAAICQKAFCRLAGRGGGGDPHRRGGGHTCLGRPRELPLRALAPELKRQLDAGRLGELYQVSFRLQARRRPGEAGLSRPPALFPGHGALPRPRDGDPPHRRLPLSSWASRSRDGPARPAQPGHQGGGCRHHPVRVPVGRAAPLRRQPAGRPCRRQPPADHGRAAGAEGSAGVMRLDGYGRLFHRAFGSNEETRARLRLGATPGSPATACWRLQRHVVDHLTRGTPMMNTAREYLANLRVEAAVYESASTGKTIEVAP